MSYLPQHFTGHWTTELPVSLCCGPLQSYQYSMYWTNSYLSAIVACCIIFSISTQTSNNSLWLPNDTKQWSDKTLVFPPVFCIIEICIWIKENSILDLNYTLMKGDNFYIGIIKIRITYTLYSTIIKPDKISTVNWPYLSHAPACTLPHINKYLKFPFQVFVCFKASCFKPCSFSCKDRREILLIYCTTSL